MKKNLLSLFLLLAGSLSLFAAGRGDSFKYAVGVCHFTPRDDADRAVIRAIIATLELNGVEAMVYDTGTESTGMQARVDLLIRDRGVYGIIIVSDDQAAAVEITAKCAKKKVPVAILGRGPEDLETFPAIVVVHDGNRGHEKLMEGIVSLCGGKSGPFHPLILTADPDSEYTRWLVGRFKNASYRAGGEWREPRLLEAGASRSETRTILVSALKENRTTNPIILPGRDIEALRIPLLQLGRWLDSDDPLHVVVGCLDGSAEAFNALAEGYVDLVGGRDVVREAESLVYPLLENIKRGGEQASLRIPVPGRIITRGDLTDRDRAAWDENLPLVPPYQTEREARKGK